MEYQHRACAIGRRGICKKKKKRDINYTKVFNKDRRERMRGSEGGEGCWMFGGSRGGSSSAQLRADVLQSYRSHPSRRRILHHTCKCLSRLKAISQHLPPHVSPRIGAENTLFFFAFSALPFTGVGAVRVGVTGRSDISIQTQSRNDITQVGGLIGPPEG